MQGAIEADLLERLGQDALDDAGDDVADEQDEQEPDELRQEAEDVVETLLDRVADLDGGKGEHGCSSEVEWTFRLLGLHDRLSGKTCNFSCLRAVSEGSCSLPIPNSCEWRSPVICAASSCSLSATATSFSAWLRGLSATKTPRTSCRMRSCAPTTGSLAGAAMASSGRG